MTKLSVTLEQEIWELVARVLQEVADSHIDAMVQTDESMAEADLLYDTVARIRTAERRKGHVVVPQRFYLEYIREYGPQTMGELAAIFDVSVPTAKRKLDGLVAHGKLETGRTITNSHTTFYLPTQTANTPDP